MGAPGTVLVTGCGSGFGRLTAELLARQGYSVVAGIRAARGRAAAVAGELRAWAARENLGLTVADLDVMDDRSVAEAVGAAGPVDVLVNNAGVLAVGVTEAFTPEQIRAVFDVNVFGAHRVARAVLPGMRERGSGLIVQVSSVLARVALPLHGVYCAGKAALEALTEAMRDELIGSGVDVVLVEPGPYPTALAGKIIGPADPTRAIGYPAAGELDRRITAGFEQMLGGPDPPDPHEVAEAVARLIARPAGTRPLRTVVGRAVQETTGFNEVAERFRRNALAPFGPIGSSTPGLTR